jgi:hypothetical protein
VQEVRLAMTELEGRTMNLIALARHLAHYSEDILRDPP